jgi:hypothetical protein
MVQEAEEDESTQVTPRKQAAGASEPLRGFAWFLAAATILVASGSGLLTAFEAIGHGSGHEYTQSIETGRSKMSYVVPTEGNPVATVGVAFRLLFVLGCIAAVAFAASAFGKQGGFDARAALAYAAAGLATLRLFVAGIDYILVEQAVELARNDARKSAGYSYMDSAAGLSAAEDFGTSAMLIVGMAVVIYWAITAVVFWPTKADHDAPVDRMP